MIERLFVNGCSFTYGLNLVDKTTDPWGAQIAKRLNLPFSNAAVAGSANEFIQMRTLLAKPENSLVITGWSSTKRFGVYQGYDYPIAIQPRFVGLSGKDGKKHYSRMSTEHFEKIVFQSEQYYKMQDDIADLIRLINQMLSLQGWLENRGCVSFQFFALVNDLEYWKDNTLYPELLDMYNQLNPETFWLDETLQDLIGGENKKIMSDDSYHPTKLAHSIWADKLINRFDLKRFKKYTK